MNIIEQSQILAHEIHRMFDSSNTINPYIGADIQVFNEIGSTNQYALANYKGKQGMYVAWKQTQGRGRHGKRWESTVGNIAMSFSWPMQIKMFDGLSLACGIAVAQTLQEYGIVCALKWPNDVLVDNKKMVGILVELQEFSQQYNDTIPYHHWVAVIGIGVNFSTSPQGAIALCDITPTTHVVASAYGKAHTKLLFCAKLAKNLADVLKVFTTEGFTPLRTLWLKHDVWLGQRVQLYYKDVAIIGSHAGVDERGRLLIHRDGTLETITSAASTLRLYQA